MNRVLIIDDALAIGEGDDTIIGWGSPKARAKPPREPGAADAERQRLAALKRARKAARQAKGMR